MQRINHSKCISTHDINKIIRRSRNKNPIVLLQKIQNVVGYIPVDAMIEIAKYTKKYEVDVYGVATFYNQFRLKPPGKHQIKVCMGTACHIKNSERILDIWKRKLEIEEGEVTEDGKFGLERVACVGCCALAPVNVIDNEVYGKVTPTTVDGILLKLKSK